MLSSFPKNALEVMDQGWSTFEPYFRDLESRPLTTGNVSGWLADWTRLFSLLDEVYARLYVAVRLDTEDEQGRQRFVSFLEKVYTPAKEADQKVKQKFLESGLEPEGFSVPLRNMRAEADLFREENLPLETEHKQLAMDYDQIIGAQAIQWDGKELTTTQLVPVVQYADRATRERAWRQASQRVLADRERINAIWVKLMDVRRKLAANAGKSDARAYYWQERLRFDYLPADCETFHAAIEQAVVPAARRVYERRQAQMGVETLRPWDVSVDVMRNVDFTGDPLGRPPLRPFDDVKVLEDKCKAIFKRVDPALGDYFQTMRDEELLDLANRKGKAPGAFCISYPASQRPFVFANAVGLAGDVDTLLHESGHAFHDFEKYRLPYHHQHTTPSEFNEVASMAMELLASPYLLASEGGFYSEQDYARAMIGHLEGLLVFWPYMAVVDAFQHWLYTHHDAGSDPAQCDEQWGRLWNRFIRGVDWSDLEDEKITGWQRKLHLYHYPFYYVEYGLAQLGAAQVWRNALHDQAGAVASYRRALALGGTVTLPELFAAAGVKFAFDAPTMQMAVDLIESKIEELQMHL